MNLYIFQMLECGLDPSSIGPPSQQEFGGTGWRRESFLCVWIEQELASALYLIDTAVDGVEFLSQYGSMGIERDPV